jgi:hypothetical protein
MEEWNGRGGDVALALTAGGPVIADIAEHKPMNGGDVFVRLVADLEQPGASRLVTATLPEQWEVVIAAAANGYAVVWVDTSQDAMSRLLLRRFSPLGLPLDAAPTEIASVAYDGRGIGNPSIVSNGSTYLIAWWQLNKIGYYIRRLAASGEWVDDQPMQLEASGPIALASNGTDAMALSVVYPNSNSYLLRARRIAMSGPALTSPSVDLVGPTSLHSIYYLAIGSNGNDYLASWVESVRCLACMGLPQWVFVSRLRADGTRLDTPLQLHTATEGLGSMSIAASNGLYFIAFDSQEGFRGTRITSEGAVLDRNSAGEAPLLSYYPQWAGVAGLQDRFVLLLMTYSLNSPPNEFVTYLDAVTWVPSAAPKSSSLTPIISTADRLRRMPAMAVRNGVVALAYVRLDQGSGDVRRAFLRLYRHGFERRPAAGR